MRMRSAQVRNIAIILDLLITMTIGLSCVAPVGLSQNSSDPYELSYVVFSKLQAAYTPGGSTDLVSKANVALDLLQDAVIKRSQGDSNGATQSEERARSMLQDVLGQVPSSLQQAETESRNRTMLVGVGAALTVLVSTSIFALLLGSWRWYEKQKFYEMIIVEDKSNKDQSS